tara:strand:+ start:1708 stop:1905 length:198 start_codon:yes stop_codon:yes gene_type:complete
VITLKNSFPSDWRKTLMQKSLSESESTEWKIHQTLSDERLLEALKEELGMLSIDFQNEGNDEHNE